MFTASFGIKISWSTIKRQWVTCINYIAKYPNKEKNPRRTIV